MSQCHAGRELRRRTHESTRVASTRATRAKRVHVNRVRKFVEYVHLHWTGDDSNTRQKVSDNVEVELRERKERRAHRSATTVGQPE